MIADAYIYLNVHQVSPTAHKVHTILLAAANEDGIADITVGQIAALSGASVRAIRYAFEDLVALGLVVIDYQAGHVTTKGRANLYILTGWRNYKGMPPLGPGRAEPFSKRKKTVSPTADSCSKLDARIAVILPAIIDNTATLESTSVCVVEEQKQSEVGFGVQQQDGAVAPVHQDKVYDIEDLLIGKIMRERGAQEEKAMGQSPLSSGATVSAKQPRGSRYPIPVPYESPTSYRAVIRDTRLNLKRSREEQPVAVEMKPHHPPVKKPTLTVAPTFNASPIGLTDSSPKKGKRGIQQVETYTVEWMMGIVLKRFIPSFKGFTPEEAEEFHKVVTSEEYGARMHSLEAVYQHDRRKLQAFFEKVLADAVLKGKPLYAKVAVLTLRKAVRTSWYWKWANKSPLLLEARTITKEERDVFRDAENRVYAEVLAQEAIQDEKWAALSMHDVCEILSDHSLGKPADNVLFKRIQKSPWHLVKAAQTWTPRFSQELLEPLGLNERSFDGIEEPAWAMTPGLDNGNE